MSRKENTFSNQKLFTPSVVRKYTNASGVLKKQTLASVSGSGVVNEESTGSFRYDPPGSPLKSTQQLPLDFSKFENHTFFSSAEVNVNLAYEKIINKFPFDGKRKDYEDWLDDLTGFEKHVLNNYPQYTGYLTFHGSGEYIRVIDKAGVVFPSISRVNSAQTVLNPRGMPVFVEFDVAIPREASADQYLFYHSSDDNVGYAAYAKATSSTKNVNVEFSVFSGSQTSTTTAEVEKGKFTHLCFSYDNSIGERRLKIFSGSIPVATSDRVTFGSINTRGNDFIIGSGSAVPGLSFNPSQTFSGSLNNFRVYHKTRNLGEIDRYTKRTLFSDDNSHNVLNLRFNEATGSYQNNDVVLDSSGKSLHSKITGYDSSIRSEQPYTSLCEFENSVYHPTLFPGHPDVVSSNERLLSLASNYDSNNPNLITKLIPEHYFEIEKTATGESDYGSTLEGVKTTHEKYAVPGGAKIGQPQIISALLFMWGRMFDELKQMIDHVSELVHIDYDSEQSIADQLLPTLSEYYGFELSSMFRNANYDQFFNGESVVAGKTSPLISLQNQIWRRILINLPEVIRSKGTLHSIKSLFRSSGIDPDRMFRFVEYGSNNQLRLGQSRKKVTEISTMADFSGSLSYNPYATISAQGFNSHKPVLISSFLTGSRIEVGYPEPVGSMVMKDEYSPHGISNDSRDGLLTSGSWTVESRFSFPLARSYTAPQSILRLHVTGSTPAHGILLNVVADPNIDENADDPNVTLYCRPGFSSSDPTLSLRLNNVKVFDGNKWYVSVGRDRNDNIQSHVSSSYFLTLARQENGELISYHTTSSLFLESSNQWENAFQEKELLGTVYNSSGSFIVVGKQDIDSSINRHLNHSSVTSKARTTSFSGLMGHTRFWSKCLTQNERKEHARNFTSLGVENPLKNFGFSHEITGSFEKLRLDISTDQKNVVTDATGKIEPLVDFSQQFTLSSEGGVSSLSGFEPLKQVIKPERFDYSVISHLFDEPSTTNKVRILGMVDGQNIERYDTLPAPIYEIPKASEPIDDVRFSIEFSVSQALNEDIMKIFATLNSLDNALGSPNAMFSEEYFDLRQMREIYFNRLVGEVNYTSFFEFFRWIDESFDDMIANLIPKKTNYKGFNMIVEGHALERARVPYNTGDIYLGENDRRNLKGTILLRQLVGSIRKY
jgi:hypothetical protein